MTSENHYESTTKQYKLEALNQIRAFISDNIPYNIQEKINNEDRFNTNKYRTDEEIDIDNPKHREILLTNAYIILRQMKISITTSFEELDTDEHFKRIIALQKLFDALYFETNDTEEIAKLYNEDIVKLIDKIDSLIERIPSPIKNKNNRSFKNITKDTSFNQIQNEEYLLKKLFIDLTNLRDQILKKFSSRKIIDMEDYNKMIIMYQKLIQTSFKRYLSQEKFIKLMNNSERAYRKFIEFNQ